MTELVNFLAQNPEKSNAFAAVASTIVGFAALLIATVSIVIAIKSVKLQDRHNQLSLRPIPRIILEISDDIIVLAICNSGCGPLIISKLFVTDGSHKTRNIGDFIPEVTDEAQRVFLPSMVSSGAVIKAEHEVPLLRIKMQSNKAEVIDFINKLYDKILTLEYHLEYTDIYNNKFPQYVRKFNEETLI